MLDPFLRFSFAVDKFSLRKNDRKVAAYIFDIMVVIAGIDVSSCLAGPAVWGCGYSG